ncbi:MAG: flagellar hook-length control protein FliK [Planctomycetes bacterium]|nr:flagellar hook-length control protein FliK [Planctomycetota bacterium]
MQSVSRVSPQIAAPALPVPEKSTEADFAAVLGGLFAALQASPAPVAARESQEPDLAPVSRDVPQAATPREDAPADPREPAARPEDPAAEVRPEGTRPKPAEEGQVANERPAPAPAAEPEATSPRPAVPVKSVPAPQAAFVPAAAAETAEPVVPQGSVPEAVSTVPSATPKVGAVAAAAPVEPSIVVPSVVPSAVSSVVPSDVPVAVDTALETPVLPKAEVPAPLANPASPAAAALAVPVPMPAPVPGSVEPRPVAASENVAPVSLPASGPASGAAPRIARTAAPLAPAMVERISVVVKMQANQGGGRVRMLLHPPHLGALKVDVTVRDGAVFARMETETAAARHALQSHLGELRQSLEEHGLSLGQMSVHVGHGGGESQAGGFAAPGSSSPVVEGVEESVQDARLEARISRLLDVTV